MYTSILRIFSFLGVIGLVISAPVSKRSFGIGSLSSTPPQPGFGVGQFGSYKSLNLQVNDVNILQFALMLEIEQTLFYQQAFSQFSVSDMLSVGLSVSQVVELQNAAIIEQTHVDTIVTVLQSLGVSPLNQPQFYFSFKSPVDFLVQLSVQEVIATGAYLGAAGFISSKDILGAAASIMVVEARQSSFTNSVLGLNAFSDAFETPLSIEQVVSLVAPSIVSLPSGTVLDALGFNTQAFALPPTNMQAFEEVSITATLTISYSGGQQIEPPQGVSQMYCAYTVGSSSFYTPFDSSAGCSLSSSLQVGTVAFVQITVSENVDVSSLLTAGQYITVVN